MYDLSIQMDALSERAKLVTKAKEMIQYYSQFKLKPLQLKLIDTVIALMNPQGEALDKVTLSTEVLCRHLGMVTGSANSIKGFHFNRKIKDLCASLMGTDTSVAGNKTILKQKPWFEEVVIHSDGIVTITLCSKLRQFLLINNEVGNLYYSYELDFVKKLDNREAILLYMILNSILKCDGGRAVISIEDLISKLCLKPDETKHTLVSNKNDEYYQDALGNKIGDSLSVARNFKRLVLGQAIDLIKTHTDITVTYNCLPEDAPDTKKTHIEFFVRHKDDCNKPIGDVQLKRALNFIEIEPGKVEMLEQESLSEYNRMKERIRELFKDEAKAFISVFDQKHIDGLSLESIFLRVEWLTSLKTLCDLYGDDEMYNTAKIRNIHPALVNHAFSKKTDSAIMYEIDTIKYQLKRLGNTKKALPAPANSGSNAKVNLLPAVMETLKIAVHDFFMKNEHIWYKKETDVADKIRNLNVSNKSRLASGFMMLKVHDTVESNVKVRLVTLSCESQQLKESFLPSYEDIQDICYRVLGNNIPSETARSVLNQTHEILLYTLPEMLNFVIGVKKL